MACLAIGGTRGLRLKGEADDRPWALDDAGQWGEPYLLLGATGRTYVPGVIDAAGSTRERPQQGPADSGTSPHRIMPVIIPRGGKRGYVEYGCHTHKNMGACGNKPMIRQACRR